ncbi:hypothetical protein NSE01_40050 [Novosphingobium sediminis]|uniref:Uncharacterized protein n=1 Tax=Novosphingobium sediminis TaxID=707214 RepID=A0A512AR38_9SPHN|nr:hypothetical protein NSE01_40050 [Novosphingobium sediminis]
MPFGHHAATRKVADLDAVLVARPGQTHVRHKKQAITPYLPMIEFSHAGFPSHLPKVAPTISTMIRTERNEESRRTFSRIAKRGWLTES